MDSPIIPIGITISSLNILALTFVLFRFIQWQSRNGHSRSFKAVWLSYFNMIIYFVFFMAYLDIIRGFIMYNGFLFSFNHIIIDMTYIGQEISNLFLLYFRVKALDMDPKIKSLLLITFILHVLVFFGIPFYEYYGEGSTGIVIIISCVFTLLGNMAGCLEIYMLYNVWKSAKQFAGLNAISSSNIYRFLFNYGVIACSLNITIGLLCKLLPVLLDPDGTAVTSRSKYHEIWYEFGRVLTTIYLYIVTSMKMVLSKPKQVVLTGLDIEPKASSSEKTEIRNARALKTSEVSMGGH